MLRRCFNPNNADFKCYGGRGITVCERWKKYENFLADMGEAPAGLSIDRIDNDKGYYPGNCRWATTAEQNGNKRSTVRITANGKTKTRMEWARAIGVHPATIRYRVKRGWDPVRAATEKPKRNSAVQTWSRKDEGRAGNEL
jgi:hypothetical protein